MNDNLTLKIKKTVNHIKEVPKTNIYTSNNLMSITKEGHYKKVPKIFTMQALFNKGYMKYMCFF